MKSLLTITLFILIVLVVATPGLAKQKGCCAGHGGIASCDEASGKWRCKDGELSTHCKCVIDRRSPKRLKYWTPESSINP
jgi:hypothetical protein